MDVVNGSGGGQFTEAAAVTIVTKQSDQNNAQSTGQHRNQVIFDDYSRFIVSWRLCTGISASDVSDTLDDALDFTGSEELKMNHIPRLLSDKDPCCISGELENAPTQFVNAYNHERYHESLNNLTPADVYYGRGRPGGLSHLLNLGSVYPTWFDDVQSIMMKTIPALLVKCVFEQKRIFLLPLFSDSSTPSRGSSWAKDGSMTDRSIFTPARAGSTWRG